MNRFAAVLLFVTACRVEGPGVPGEMIPGVDGGPKADPAVTEPASPVLGGSSPAASRNEPVAEAEPVGWTRVDLAVEDGALDVQLRAQAQKARAAGQTPFVQLYADWCRPCRELRTAMSDARMQEAFKGTWIIRLDANKWGAVFHEKFPEQFAIPAFYAVRTDGTIAQGVTGNAWAENLPENMAPVLGKYFRDTAAAPVP